MFNDHTSRNRLFALLTFLTALILYSFTMAPTASFWDAGEFIAVANGLQVTHPPGAPFYLLLGRLFSMFMTPFYVAAAVNFLSVVSSALTIMLLYLIVVRLVREWSDHPDQMSLSDMIGMYGGGILGAFTFMVTDTFWFNAVEAEVYALSMLFTALVVWLALKWSEYHDQPYSERWLVLILYLFGLASGVHLLNLLAIFFVGLIIYFKKFEPEIKTLVIAGVLMALTFFSIYPFTMFWIPDLADNIGDSTYGLIGPLTYFLLIGAIIGGGIYYTHQKKYRWANIILVGYAMILIGYSSYSLVFIRSLADPPIDENDPETVDAFVRYLKREQYGSTPLIKGNSYSNEKGDIDRDNEVFFPRRYSTEGRHVKKYAEYSSDFDYFLSYQVNHMYLRYFNWNFIGRDSDIQDAAWQGGFIDTPNEDNEAHNSYYYLPFLIGIFGLLFHFQRDWKRALAVFTLFFMTGIAIVIYLNQYPFQPRERDYAYVGSFFAFAIWVGLGGTGLVETVKELTKGSTAASYGTVGLLLVALPLWMGMENFQDHDRSERYVAPDYAYNLLNSTAPNAIIFTNGDNDTFPLWYAQEVEGVRTDVRVVCLSLLNTDWYIRQLRDQWSHESPPLPISYTDEQLENLEEKFRFRKPSDFWEPKTIKVPVDKEMLAQAYSSETSYRAALGITPTDRSDVDYLSEETKMQIPVDSLDDEISWYYKGNFLARDRQGNDLYYTRIQDDLILDLIQTNRWIRPIYFANTVSSSSQLNLQPFFRVEGQAYRILPKRFASNERTPYGYIEPGIHAKRLRSFRYRGMDDEDAYFDENIRRMLNNYRYGFMQLAEEYEKRNMPDSAAYWLAFSEDRIPFSTIPGDSRVMVDYASTYAKFGADDNALALAEETQDLIVKDLEALISDLDQLEARITYLDEESKEARRNAELSRQRELRAQMQQLISRYQNKSQDLQLYRYFGLKLQQTYYLIGADEKGLEIATIFNSLTGEQIQFPTSKEANRNELQRYNLN